MVRLAAAYTDGMVPSNADATVHAAATLGSVKKIYGDQLFVQCPSEATEDLSARGDTIAAGHAAAQQLTCALVAVGLHELEIYRALPQDQSVT